MQRGKSTKTNIQRGWGRYFLMGCVGTLLAIILLGLVCGILFFRGVERFTEIPSDFCNEEDGLYQELVSNGDQWAEEFSTIATIYMDVFTSSGNRLHLLRDRERLGFFVAVTLVPRSLWGKAGYFYSHTGELPRLHPDDELTHLGGNIYCYVIAYP